MSSFIKCDCGKLSVNGDDWPSFENSNAENSIPANYDGKEKESVDINSEKNKSPEDAVESVASLPYAIQFPNDPAFISNITMSPELFAQVALQPPCQPAPFDLKNHKFPTKKQGKYTRSFHEGHYLKKIASGQFVKRNWVSYSPTADRVYCIVCKLFGTTECKSYKLAKSGYDNWKHLAYVFKKHEATPDHLQAEIRRAMYINNQRVDLQSFQGLNSKVAENREIVKEIIKTLLFLSGQNMAFRGHNENWKCKGEESVDVLIKYTTTDVANLEQFSLFVRFLNEDRDVEERLVAMKSYDGAASMQGCYSSVKTLVQEKNPRAIYVWCFAHVLNLVVVDRCDKNIVTRIFFANLQSLVSFMRARKRTALFIEAQKKYYPNERICKIKNFSNTRWTSHHQVLRVICTKYKAVMKTLKDLSLSHDRETSSTAKNLQTVMSSFMFSSSIDFIQALTIVDNCAKSLSDMREDHLADRLLDDARQFAEDNGLKQRCFPNKRKIIKKVMDGENKGNETIFLSPNKRYKVEVYNTVLDQIVSSITSRFEGARKILADLSFFSYERLISINEGCSIPEDCFIYLKTWIQTIQIDELKMEYITFAKCFMELKNGINIKKLHKESGSDNENDDDELNDSSSDTETESNTDTQQITALDIIKLLNSYNLISALPNLYTAYKYACTIPATSASCERSFSKLKLIITRLRSTMKQNLLEPIMLLSCERNIDINEDEAVNNYANSSQILKEALLFK
ncbi:zinc finger MYM-type protein 1-like [Myzus persicae]|uniref:zinc finger MYM-type protein 1-like n=1 Tax=Myzus persicae TaxID=13164 RepID=UPI000B93257D|nr:zinc finger MYM-type protein 1-like [Myzus persicae]